jgi:RHS repeat-associated protein
VFERGTGKYVLVLADPRTTVDDPKTGKKRAHEPDVARHGGKVLFKKDGTRVIKLPVKAAGALRKEQNVAYLQRIWLGESAQEWAEEQSQSSSLRSEATPAVETDPEGLTWATGDYLYDGSGNIKQIGSATYQYDTLGRLKQSVANGVTETYQYDSFGNLVEKSVNGVIKTTPVDAVSNRLRGETYDVAGNLTTRAGTPQYHYDPFSMIDAKERPSQRIIYGPDDERIGVINDSSLSRWKIRDFNGQVLREFKGDDVGGYWLWLEDYIYAGGRAVAAEREAYFSGKRYLHTDHLGTVRMITTQDRKRLGVHEFSPFGVERTDVAQETKLLGEFTGGDSRSEPMKFTGHERDWDGWLNVDNDDYVDYMHARYYDPNLGRFLSVDPVLQIKRAMTYPQMWNRYSYTANNPVKFVDPTGRILELPAGCADQKATCKELRDLRNGVPVELRMLVRAVKNKDGGAILDKRFLNVKSGASSGNFQTLRAIANDRHVATFKSSTIVVNMPGADSTWIGRSSDIAGVTVPASVSASGKIEAYSGNDLNARESAETTAHELRHVRRMMLGQSYLHEDDDTNGPVNTDTAEAVREAGETYDPFVPPL